ncbi:MAG TPA: DUF1385 domain-containing protein [Anaerolineales bacterium]|nr:DUF1385 domain-containing protein [Anaerolineales bacterium]
MSQAPAAKHGSQRLPSYGGQAVIEGVMMRGQRVCATAVRAPDGTIVVQTSPLSSLYRGAIPRIPFARGLLALVDALVLGMRSLSFSAGIQAGESLGTAPIAVSMIVALVAGIGLFFLLPAAVAHWVETTFGWSALASNLLEGLIRLGLLVGYVGAIGYMPEIRRVYGYHGAEHMTIHAFEARAPLDPASIAAFPREHPRCGTAFLLTVVVLSVVLFSVLGPLPLLLRLVSRLLLIPVLAAVAYEYIRFTGRWIDTWWGRLLAAPNLALQRLTTRKPELAMIEVATAAFEAMRQGETPAS